MGDGRQSTGRCARVVNHVPNHSIRNGDILGGSIHSHCDRTAAPQRPADPATNAGQAEVVSEHRDSGLSHPPNNCPDLFDLLRTLRAVQQNVMPVRGVEILDGCQNQARVFNLLAKFF